MTEAESSLSCSCMRLKIDVFYLGGAYLASILNSYESSLEAYSGLFYFF